ncbi:MAG: DUF922 domain-containing protein [Candidatus Azambacteria bacterium]|nr:DUF922 domain-containing protein [Candidatus Azambacteria bacterium]
MLKKIVKISLIVLGVLVLAFVGLVLYEMVIGLPESPSETLPSKPLSKEVKKPAACFFITEPEETWPDETVSDPPIGNIELVKTFHPDETFDVFGSNVREVAISMNDNAIAVDTFGTGLASTGSETGFSWRYKNTAAGCILTSAKVTLDITLTFPNWVDKVSATGQDQKMWDLYQKFVKRHEQGHINVVLKEARGLQAEFSQVKSEPSCQELKDKMNALAKQAYKKRAEADDYYDKRTRRGSTQIPHERDQMQYAFPFTCNWSEVKI